MTDSISAREARDNFTDLLGNVYYGKQTITIKKKGRPFAVVMNPDEYQNLKDAAKADFFTQLKKIQEPLKNIPAATLQKDIDNAVKSARKHDSNKA